MGVNMPARSVIFTAWVKHDGAQRRALLPSEYTQMAGRAGRRGLDSEGHVFLLCGDEVPDQKQITRMMTSKAEPLASRFRVTFAMILQMKRFAESGVRVEDLLGQSFLENARARRRPEARRHLKDRMQQLEALPALQCILGEPDIQDYAAFEDEARLLGTQLHMRLYDSKSRDRIFCPGRGSKHLQLRPILSPASASQA
ncbi:SKI2 [Symbiodinium necroappetens]|uniref:SKI2 protein n=1 Tax=Symbiodinium necroappetens TaxID=1628268 RepID=A0A812LEQ6_9DINO|nr:SKI2 [Symbiodinium necroappetens]